MYVQLMIIKILLKKFIYKYLLITLINQKGNWILRYFIKIKQEIASDVL